MIEQGRRIKVAANASSARTMAPELLAARIVLRVAELRLLAAWTSVLAGRVRPPEAQRHVPRWGRSNFWQLERYPARLESGRKFTAITKGREMP
jgi:hypothetical protein